MNENKVLISVKKEDVEEIKDILKSVFKSDSSVDKNAPLPNDKEGNIILEVNFKDTQRAFQFGKYVGSGKLDEDIETIKNKK